MMKCRDCEHWGWGDDEGTHVWGWCWIRTSCPDPDIGRSCPDFLPKAPDISTALRPVSREWVEKVWRGEWTPGDPICPVCEKNKFDGLDADIWADWMPSFCPNCGAPMTDKAVDMVMERLEELRDEKG